MPIAVQTLIQCKSDCRMEVIWAGAFRWPFDGLRSVPAFVEIAHDDDEAQDTEDDNKEPRDPEVRVSSGGCHHHALGGVTAYANIAINTSGMKERNGE